MVRYKSFFFLFFCKALGELHALPWNIKCTRKSCNEALHVVRTPELLPNTGMGGNGGGGGGGGGGGWIVEYETAGWRGEKR